MSYVHNPYPTFEAPAHHGQRPAFIRKLVNYASKRKVCYWEGFRALWPIDPATLKPIHRQRHFNLHRARAIQAVVIGIAHHLNIVTGIVKGASIELLAHQCGLATKSKAGNESITRASRAIITLEQFGVLRCEKVWDKTAGTWIPKLIEITPLFLDMCGINREEYERAQQQQLGFEKRGLSLAEQEELTISEARRRAKLLHRQAAFERRRKQDKDHAARKLAKKLAQKSLDEQRRAVQNDLIKMLGADEIKRLGVAGFKELVDRELGRLRRIAADPPT